MVEDCDLAGGGLFSFQRITGSLVALGLLVGCGAADEQGGAVPNGDPVTAQASAGPLELVVHGKRYLKVSSLSEAQQAELKDPSLWKGEETVDKLAQLLRAYMAHTQYGEYVEAEPNYKLARISLGLEGGDRPTRGGQNLPAPEVMDKSVTADGDQRAKTAFPNTNPSNAYALYEAGGSGTMVGGRVYSAGHIIYNNAADPGTDGWKCKDGSARASCAVPGYSRWRFGGVINTVNGVETQTWASDWAVCGFVSVPNGWVNLASNASGTQKARWDYSVQNLDGCVPAGAGNVGWWVTDQATLRTRNLFEGGYAQLQPCPALAVGNSTDCPSGVNQLRSNTPGSAYSGGSLFWTNGGASDPALVATGGYIQSSKMDITFGQSGGGLIALDGGSWWAVGTTCNGSANQSSTNYNQMTWEVEGFLYQ